MTALQLTELSWRLRTARADDDRFLLELYGSTRGDLDVLGWPEAIRQQFCELQWRAQRAGYAATHPGAIDHVVEVDDAAVGRLLVDADQGDLCVVDLALLPTHRGQGLGRALLEEVQREAARDGRDVRLSVQAGNPARVLYELLGFVEAGSHGLHTELRWTP